jgi:mycofactocin precursor
MPETPSAAELETVEIDELVADDELLEDDLLGEDVSIDGMCGVY